MDAQSQPPEEWQGQADVVVVGYGCAEASAAITAHDLGAGVLLLEKAPRGQEGGNTRVAGQGYLTPSTPEKAMTYLKALCGPYAIPDDMIRVWAEETCQNNDWFKSIGGDPQEHQHQPAGIEFPELPGWDSVHKFHHGRWTHLPVPCPMFMVFDHTLFSAGPLHDGRNAVAEPSVA